MKWRSGASGAAQGRDIVVDGFKLTDVVGRTVVVHASAYANAVQVGCGVISDAVGAAADGAEGGECAKLTGRDYRASAVDAVAELPGFAVLLITINRCGRRWSMGGMFGVAAACMFLLLPCMAREIQEVWLFVARLAAASYFQVRWGAGPISTSTDQPLTRSVAPRPSPFVRPRSFSLSSTATAKCTAPHPRDTIGCSCARFRCFTSTARNSTRQPCDRRRWGRCRASRASGECRRRSFPRCGAGPACVGLPHLFGCRPWTCVA